MRLANARFRDPIHVDLRPTRSVWCGDPDSPAADRADTLVEALELDKGLVSFVTPGRRRRVAVPLSNVVSVDMGAVERLKAS